MQDGYTVIMMAAGKGHGDIVHLLIDKGADLNMQDIVSELLTT